MSLLKTFTHIRILNAWGNIFRKIDINDVRDLLRSFYKGAAERKVFTAVM